MYRFSHDCLVYQAFLQYIRSRTDIQVVILLQQCHLDLQIVHTDVFVIYGSEPCLPIQATQYPQVSMIDYRQAPREGQCSDRATTSHGQATRMAEQLTPKDLDPRQFQEPVDRFWVAA